MVSGEDRFGSYNRECIINDYTSPQSINEQPNAIIVIRADFCGLEESFDNERILTD